MTSIGRYAFENCRSLTSVYYHGTSAKWNNISIGSNNSPLAEASLYYYSETEPPINSDGTEYDGNYWHYVNGEIVVWKKQ